MRNYLWVVCVVLISQQNRGLAKEKECENDAECEVRWPQSFCRKGTCKCKPNYVRQKSESRGWVCLSVLDATNSELGPPLTCPLPDGAGFRVIYKDPNGASVFCQLKEHDGADKLPPCPDGYECIHSIGFLSGDWDGVCCPKQEKSCDPDIKPDQNGWLERWYFDGEKCQKFMWNPMIAKSPNTYTTENHCLSYCMKA